jgi:hypothetical protein
MRTAIKPIFPQPAISAGQSTGFVDGIECQFRGKTYAASFDPSEYRYTVDGTPTDWHSLPDGVRCRVQRAVAHFIGSRRVSL